jgi:hypothetical protein
MRIWMAGFATRTSAVRATKWGGVAAFLGAAREIIGIVTGEQSSGYIWIAVGIVSIVMFIAGVRLFEGNGRFSGIIASLLMAGEIAIFSLVPLSPFAIGSLLATTTLVILIANGVRGAFALRFFDGTGLRKVFD